MFIKHKYCESKLTSYLTWICIENLQQESYAEFLPTPSPGTVVPLTCQAKAILDSTMTSSQPTPPAMGLR